jgi:uncharacterized membrane protein
MNTTNQSRLLTFGVWLTGLTAMAAMAAAATLKYPEVWLASMPVYCLAALALAHSIAFLGARRAIWFLAIGLIVPYVAEYLGVNFNAVFGGHWYRAAHDLGLPVGVRLPGSVPLATVLTWYEIVYLGFVSSVYILKADRSDLSSFATVPMAAGLLVALWQVVAGPATVGRLMVQFTQNGFYHSIPLSNFTGWFVTAMFTTLFFQVVEPAAVEFGRFDRRQCPTAELAPLLFGFSVLYSTAVCLRLGFNGAGFIGCVVLLLFTAVAVARTRSLGRESERMVQQPTGA